MSHLTLYQLTLLILSVWLVLALAPQIPILARSATGFVDWSVVGFRASLLLLGACVALRYFFDLTPWIIVVGWLVLDVSATINTVYIVQRSRNGSS